MPVLFIAHGGGPMPLLGQQDNYLEHFRSIPSLLPSAPTAVLCISAHWEEAEGVAVTANEAHSLLFDYSGFPEEAYTISYPVHGAPHMAARVQNLLRDAGITCRAETVRGLDHGTFVPLKPAWPDASVPVVQLSLNASLDPATHIRMGKALSTLREEGVLILGSGMSFHNMQAFFTPDPSHAPMAQEFDDFLRGACASDARRREELLTGWKSGPHALFCHPREEHLLPLMVCAGAAQQDTGSVVWTSVKLPDGIRVSSFKFG